jgi:septum formation protein
MILLASQSPQRSLLLAAARVTYRVVRSAADEETVVERDPVELALGRARLKARLAEPADGVVLGADTVVALAGVEHGKPRDHADARRMLAALSGTTHQVITGHWLAVKRGGAITREAGRAVTAEVSMRTLSSEEIADYVASGESMGRAGSYAIQEHGERLVMRLDGAWDTVVGLHVEAVDALYRELLSGPLPRS